MIIELAHRSDPRYLLVDELPKRITIDDLSSQRYGKIMVYAPEKVTAVYIQPGGPGTDWILP